MREHAERKPEPHALVKWLLPLVLLPSCGESVSKGAHPIDDASAENMPREVRTTVVRDEAWPRALNVTGQLVAFEQATVATELTGRMESLAVDMGTRVKRGDVLATIDARRFEQRRAAAVAAMQAARARLGLASEGDDDRVVVDNAAIVRTQQAQLAEAKASFDRVAPLAQSGATSRATIDTATMNLHTAESRYQDALEEIHNRRALLAQRRAELALAERDVSLTRITAPFDGIVRERRTSPGDFLAEGSPIATVVRVDPLRLRIEIPERDAPVVRVGQRVRLRIAGVAIAREERLTRASPSISERSRTLVAEADVPNPSGELRPGSFAQVEIEIDENARALTVEIDAVVRFAGIDKLIVVKDGKAAEKRVTIGRTDAQRVEILSGAVAGDEVVVAPGNLQSGATVRPARTQ